ncbi:hypothetical protein [Streptomyces pinistramenti]|uniref:hypothetical protein n=1 Tax=Streptomyces pinistramenti TaxID=2884812 RepID=UPI001D079DAE|nr:hypothetical protein [Streptomyces pinistramenti]MCB5910397.1 hypothetical protein [Streptomyces pinistramenti]
MTILAERSEPLVGRCYTKVRRHAPVVGHWPGGGRIWGGPYTVPQLVVASGTFAVLFVARGLWAHHGLVDVLLLVGVPYALALIVGRVHIDGRNPLAVAASAVGLAVSGSGGRMGGRPVPRFRRRAVVGVCTLARQPQNDESGRGAVPAPEAGPVAEPLLADRGAGLATGVSACPSAAAPVVRVTSGVGALLAARSAGTPHADADFNERGQ